MKKLKYALSHGKFVIIILIVAVYFISSGIYDVVSQYNSAKCGIEVLLIDTTVSYGSTKKLENDIKKTTGVKYVGAATLAKEDAMEYVATIENYSLKDYIEYLTDAKNCEAVFVTKSMLNEVYSLKKIVPLGLEGDFGEECYHNSVLYAIPLTEEHTAEFEASIIALQEQSYAVLLDGDHVDQMRNFLKKYVEEA